MTFKQWVNKYNGTRFDFDGVSGVQCVDTVKSYIYNVLNIQPQAIGNAIDYWNRQSNPYIANNFNTYAYKKGFKFQEGDIIVMKGSSVYGHIVVSDGKYDSKGVYAYDENYMGTGAGMTRHYFPYNGHYTLVGILRPKAKGNTTVKKTKTAIDISDYNVAVDFSKINVDAVIIRVGYRGYGDEGRLVLDKKFEQYIKAANKAGIPVGVYFYSQAISTAEAKKEADFALKYIKGHNITLPVYFDAEFAELKGSFVGRLYKARLSRDKFTRIAQAFCDRIISKGYKAGVYANYDFFKNKYDTPQLNKYSLWIAHYSAKTLPVVAGAKFDMWQYRPDGRINGVTGMVDMNYVYFDVNKKLKVTYTNYVTTANLNYRNARNTTAKSKVGVYKKGTTVKVAVGSEKTENGFVWVTLSNGYYVAKKYLKKK